MFFLKSLPTQEMLEHYADRYPEMDVAVTDEALRLMRRASILLRELEAYFRKFGLSQTRFLILILLDRENARNNLKLADLVERLDVSKPVITTTLQALWSDGLVALTACREDRRAKRISITREGRDLLHLMLPGYYRLINAQMAELAAQEG